MYSGYTICALLPARDEAASITRVIDALKQLNLIDRIIVCDNGSSDDTAELAIRAGAELVSEPIPGYGAACQKAIAQVGRADILLFVDADHSVLIAEAINLLDPLVEGADITIGARVPQWRAHGSMTSSQQFGNWLASRLIKLIWRYRITDLGPFRAIKFQALKQLDMQDRRFGWTVEMQIKAIRYQLDMVEVPVHYRPRIGRSKISGTVTGVLGAGVGIIGTILKLALRPKSDIPDRSVSRLIK